MTSRSQQEFAIPRKGANYFKLKMVTATWAKIFLEDFKGGDRNVGASHVVFRALKPGTPPVGPSNPNSPTTFV